VDSLLSQCSDSSEDIVLFRRQVSIGFDSSGSPFTGNTRHLPISAKYSHVIYLHVMLSLTATCHDIGQGYHMSVSSGTTRSYLPHVSPHLEA
jgi:hypothetical protein